MRRRTIKEKVECHEVLRRNGFSFRHSSDQEEQFSCPFHGRDEKPSARVFPSEGQNHSHVYCFVCKPSPPWDAISLWKKFSGDDKKHHTILSELEKAFGIEAPPIPDGTKLPQGPTHDELKKDEFGTLLEACETRLIDSKVDYHRFGDLRGYLMVGSVLDKANYQTAHGHMAYGEGVLLLHKVMQKIAERIRGCPVQ